MGSIVAVSLMVLGIVLYRWRSRHKALSRSDAVSSPYEENTRNIDPFPLLTSQVQRSHHASSSGMDVRSPVGSTRKGPQGYGVAADAEHTSVDSATLSPPATAYSVATEQREELSETSMTRLVYQVLRRIHNQDAPPAYD